ncbi:hypothetical protein AQUCO_02300127v1 [Aquilegia coerulea]|uniref:TTF-type domain-containing protein n=1 Tax=Aquilegia coerulea TaxID=218851 RepID=A0A2G5DD15_AQUCA|nr:hypothetical protein AQUCO_02300127v1 [Aquilegia coerulea]
MINFALEGVVGKRRCSEVFDLGFELDGKDERLLYEPELDIDLSNLPTDPGLRKKNSEYPSNVRDNVRRAYLLNGPYQPDIEFPQTKGNEDENRKFVIDWYKEFTWIEYSIENDVAFCLYCYLFKPESRNRSQGGGDAFMATGFKNWKKKQGLRDHVGGPSSAHNQAYRKGQDLLNQNQHIETVLQKQSSQARSEYRVRLKASVDCVRFLLKQGLAFRGHNETTNSNNRGNFLELLEFSAFLNKDIKDVVLQNAPENNKLTAHVVQKDIVNSFAVETTNVILKELGDAFFSVLIDESRDISVKEQMAVVIRFVDDKGCVIERFLGIVHVRETTALSLKAALEELFSKHGLSIGRLRGQGYDGASNMRGQFGGLKTLIMNANESAYYVHCFAHQLQLALVGVAKNHPRIALLFNLTSNALNIVGVSCKRRDLLREKHASKVIQKIQSGDILSGQGLNQETALKRSGDTRWGSHYGTLVSFILMHSSVIDVLEVVMENALTSEQRGEACALLDQMQSFEFIFNLHLMKDILGITSELSKALQREDQEIVNAMTLVKVAKQRLNTMRNDGWDSFFAEVSSFCVKNDIIIPNMDDPFVERGRSRRRVEVLTNQHYYRVQLFIGCIDLQNQEPENRFNEEKLIRLDQFYPRDFSSKSLMLLSNQLETYILDVRFSNAFSELRGIGDLAKKMVETRKNTVYPLVYMLMTLALILPVATAGVERAFSAMNIIKNKLRNRMADDWMNDILVTYIEKDICETIDDETIMQRFQKMATRRGQL